MANAIVHFEIHAENPSRAIRFYTDAFGWRFEKWGEMDYWAVYTGRSDIGEGKTVGIDGGLLPRKGGAPVDGAAVNAFVITLDVDNIEAAMKKVVAAGGKQVVEKQEVGGMGWQAFCKDTEGNIFGLFEVKEPS